MNHQINLVNPAKLPPKAEFTPELAKRRVIEQRHLIKPGEYGFRIVLLSDATGDQRLILAAQRYADDKALAAGVRGERMGTGERSDYASSAGGYTQVQLDAQKRVREANAKVGPVFAQILHDTLIDCLQAAELSRIWKISKKTAAAWAFKSYTALADHYDNPTPR